MPRKRSVFRRLSKPSTFGHDNSGIHVGVNVAIDLNNAWPREIDAAAAPFRVIAEVERLRSRKRKDVVEDGIEIGEIDSGPDRDYQQAGIESTIPLPHHRFNGRRGDRCFRFKPDGDALIRVTGWAG